MGDNFLACSRFKVEVDFIVTMRLVSKLQFAYLGLCSGEFMACVLLLIKTAFKATQMVVTLEGRVIKVLALNLFLMS